MIPDRGSPVLNWLASLAFAAAVLGVIGLLTR